MKSIALFLATLCTVMLASGAAVYYAARPAEKRRQDTNRVTSTARCWYNKTKGFFRDLGRTDQSDQELHSRVV